MTTALIADDEPLLREVVESLLSQLWPELKIVARARNGREAVDLFEATNPAVCFLDIRMPGLSGLEAAQLIGHRAHIVFVTAYDEYAVKAFDAGVLDYLVKPVSSDRLGETVQRLKDRIESRAPAVNSDQILAALMQQLKQAEAPAYMRWLKVQVGTKLRMIAVEDIDYFRADAKYTLVAWRNEAGQPAEALVRTALKDLVSQFDPSQFAQIHRSAAVNLDAVSHMLRGENETGILHLKGRTETLPVSRAHVGLFRPAKKNNP